MTATTSRPEPDVPVPYRKYGMPSCPSDYCGYACTCCCHCSCQTPCPAPDADGDCDCDDTCHGGHDPWDCADAITRYRWAKDKAERLANDR